MDLDSDKMGLYLESIIYWLSGSDFVTNSLQASAYNYKIRNNICWLTLRMLQIWSYIMFIKVLNYNTKLSVGIVMLSHELNVLVIPKCICIPALCKDLQKISNYALTE